MILSVLSINKTRMNFFWAFPKRPRTKEILHGY